MNLLIQWHDNLLELRKAGIITKEQLKNLAVLEAKIKELKIGTNTISNTD